MFGRNKLPKEEVGGWTNRKKKKKRKKKKEEERKKPFLWFSGEQREGVGS